MKKECFIKEIDYFINNGIITLSNESMIYFEALKITDNKESIKFTENGKKILLWLQENSENYNNMLQSKQVAEGLQISSKTASGAIRKLVTDGYVEKLGEKPNIYSLTSKGAEVKVE